MSARAVPSIAELSRLRSLYQALSGQAADLVLGDDSDPNAGVVETPQLISIPRQVHPAVADIRSGWLRARIGHRAGHVEAGTYAFGGRAAPQLRFLQDADQSLGRTQDDFDVRKEYDWFFERFGSSGYAMRLFTALEDARVEGFVERRYRGLARHLGMTKAHELRLRPPADALPWTELVLEAVVQASLGGIRSEPFELATHQLQAVERVVAWLRAPGRRVEDAALATVILYAVASNPSLSARLLGSGGGPLADLGGSFVTSGSEALWLRAIARPLPDLAFGQRGSLLPSYRDELWRSLRHYRAALPRQESIHVARALPADSETATDGSHMAGRVKKGHAHPHQEEVVTTGYSRLPSRIHSGTFVYPEWDFRAGAYLTAWCSVEELVAGHVNEHLFDAVARAYNPLVRAIARQLERVASEDLQRIRRLRDGDDIDIEAALEAWADIRAQSTPSDRLYTRWERARRDIAVALLLDLSSSTAEPVEDAIEAGRSASSGEGVTEALLRAHGRTYRRIIEVEKESAILLMAALDPIGDTLGVYGFSGSGRSGNQFITIKDMREPLSQKVKARIGQVQPMDATRMGVAVRHATSKLARQDARTKILMLVSDGRPRDAEYGQQYGQDQLIYAMHDTRVALEEATSLGVRPMLLTVDHEGNDYLREMCHNMDYEVIADVRDLPARLLTLYRAITV